MMANDIPYNVIPIIKYTWAMTYARYENEVITLSMP
jgi:hypothetical protein